MSSEGTPLHGDRSAWNVITFDTEHAKDIMDSTLKRHLPLPGAAGGYARSDGTDWQRVNSIPLADLADYARGSIIRGGGSDWEAYSAKTDGAALVGDGTDIISDLTPLWKGKHTFNGGITLADATLTFTGTTGTNTITFPDDTSTNALRLRDAGGLEYLRLISTDTQPIIRFNDGGADIDFEIEATGVADAFQVQGADGQITLGVLTQGVVSSDAAGVLSVTAGSAIVGSGAANQVAYWTAADTLAGDAGLTYNAATGTLSLANSLTFTGATGVNDITFPDTLANALHFTDDITGLEFQRFVTTAAGQIVIFNSSRADIDFRVAGSGLTHAFSMTGSDGHIGIQIAPSATIGVTSQHTFTDPGASVYAYKVDQILTATANNARSSYAMTFISRTANVVHNFTGTVYGVQGFVGHYGSGTLTAATTVWAGSRVYGAGDITSAYGVYINNGLGGGTGDIATNYGIFIKNPLGAGGGTITGNNFVIYAENQTRGATNYFIFSAGGRSYHAGTWAIGANQITAQLFVRQPSTTATIPVQILDQRNVSEPFTDYIGTSAASAANSLSSWTAGNAIQGHIQIDVNGVKRWLRFYDDPTS